MSKRNGWSFVALTLFIISESLHAGPILITKDAGTKTEVTCTAVVIAPKLVLLPAFCFKDGDEIAFVESRYCIGDPTPCPGTSENYTVKIYSSFDTSKAAYKFALGILDQEVPEGWMYKIGGAVMEDMKVAVHRARKQTQTVTHPDGTPETFERSVFEKKDSTTNGYVDNLFAVADRVLDAQDAGAPAVGMYDGNPVLLGIGVAQSKTGDFFLRLDRTESKKLIRKFAKDHSLTLP